MKNILRLILAFSVLALTAQISLAQENIGNPGYVGIILETDTSRVSYHKRYTLNFCPLDGNRKFKARCFKQAYTFPGTKGVTYEIVDSGAYEYIISWLKPKPKALYAFSRGSLGGIAGFGATELIGPGTHTQMSVLQAGTVAVITRPFTDWKGGYASAINRAKAVFRKQYGAALTKRMKFVAFKSATVDCRFKSTVFDYQINQNSCVLK